MSKLPRDAAPGGRSKKVQTTGPEAIPSALPSPASPQTTEGRAPYVEAIALYEQALRTIQQHNYAKASELLRHVVSGFPHERELIERSRLYLALCARQLTPPSAEPENTPERLYAATLALNAGEPARAIDYLNRIRTDDPANDQALYMLAVAFAEQGDVQEAIRYLGQAVEANPDNRSLARVDPDLEPLRREEAVAALLAASVNRTIDAKRALRRR